MSSNTYGTVVGFVQFEPNEREYNGQTLTDIVVRSTATQENIRVTVWPEFDTSIEQGDFVAVDGKVSTNTYQAKDGTQKTAKNLSATNLVVLSPVPKAVSGVVSKTGV